VITFPAKARTGADGVLSLSVPTGMPDADVDVLIVVEDPASPRSPCATSNEWPAGYFELFGSLAGVDLERPAQGNAAERLPL
jgi:hypothetical protein